LDTYIFHEGELPPEVKADFEPAIFNTPSFSTLQDPLHWLSYYLIDQAKKTAVAGIRFHLIDGVASSPFRAPFGSVDCSNTIHPASLYRFIEDIQGDLKKKGATKIYIKNPPRVYFPEKGALIEVFLLNHDFAVTDSQITAVIPIGDEPFVEGIRHSQKLRIRQAQKAKFIFRNLPLAKVEEVYQFISSCHRDKGYKLSISLQDLQKAATGFADRYLLFGIYDGERMVAASVSIRVYRHILYNFLVNHEKQYNSLSPSLLLMEGTHRFCRENGITLFDLGTSAVEGEPNFPLLDFKLHIGGNPSSKVTFLKTIS
jgi:hypothetical protein